MNPEKLFEKLINNEITREEFESLLEHIDDDKLRSKYDEYLESQFMKEIETHFETPNNHAEPHLKTSYISDQVKKARAGNTRRHFTVAATLLIILGITGYLVYMLVPTTGNTSTQAERKLDEAPFLIKNTPNQRMFRMRLADGSFVHLNALSSISYPKKFTKENREVEINGEAYFDIKRDEQRPFKIKVKDHLVEVLGTSFDIKAYQNENYFSVAVESGKVSVDLNTKDIDPIILTQNQKLIFTPENSAVKILEVNIENELSWRKGILRFDSTPMAEVEHMLERWYGVEIQIADESIYQKSLSGIHQNENIKSVIESLTYATGTNYEIKENKIIIKQ